MAEAPRPVSPRRLLQLLLRSAHLAAMGIVLGGCFLGLEYHPLRHAIWVTLGTGAALLGMDIAKDAAILHQGSGLFVLLKLALLGLGNVFPQHRFGWYLAATLVASFGSHMPGSWRHYSVRYGREMGPQR